MSDQVFLYLPLEVLKPDRVLNNGTKFPMISFCTSDIEGFDNVYSAVDVALETGYRSFECTSKNKQEEYLGLALQELLPKYDLERKDVIICSKLHPKHYGADITTEAFRRSCENFQTNYLDLYFMSWPGGFNVKYEDEENILLREETWKELLSLYSQGVIKSLGVCHFTVKHLMSLIKWGDTLPTVNQVEFHPRCQQIELLHFCKENNILLQAHSFQDTIHSLVTGDPVLRKVSTCNRKSPTQVVLKWIINKGVAVVTQSSSPGKIRQNFQLYDFVLDKPSMDSLTSTQIREKYLPSSICIV